MAKNSTQIDIRKKESGTLALAGKREVSETVDFPIFSKNVREWQWTIKLKRKTSQIGK